MLSAMQTNLDLWKVSDQSTHNVSKNITTSTNNKHSMIPNMQTGSKKYYQSKHI